ncbi:MAG: NfeD family protein [Clostridia bacterium]|nr:NfeD family protein [Clostridia bacterium]
MLFGVSYAVFWLVLAIVLGIIEAVTLGVVTLWFAAGAIAAMAAAMLGFDVFIQITVFIIVSAVLLYFTRPIIKNYLKLRTESTNADRLLKKAGVVIEDIDNTEGKGQVKVMGQVWSARTFDGKVLQKGTKVEVDEISGVKLIVKQLDQ